MQLAVSFIIVVTIGGQTYKLFVLHEYSHEGRDIFKVGKPDGPKVKLEHRVTGSDTGNWRIIDGFSNPPSDYQNLCIKRICYAIGIYLDHRNPRIIKGHLPEKFYYCKRRY